MDLSKLWPIGLVIAIVGFMATTVRPIKSSDGIDYGSFGKIPIVYQGRQKPIDTLARNSLMFVSGRQTFRDSVGNKQPATRWLLDVMTYRLGNDAFLKHKTFRIEHEQVLETLKLEPRSGLRYALGEFNERLAEFERQVRQAQEVPEEERTLYDAKLLELARKVTLVMNLSSFEIPYLVPPPADSENPEEEWKTLREVLQRASVTNSIEPAAGPISEILGAYVEGSEDFDELVADYRAQLQEQMPSITKRALSEVMFNRATPLYWCLVLYVAAFILAAVGWVGWREQLNRASFWMIGTTLGFHTLGLLTRMYLEGRPPVTNLYSSAIFIGWACVILAMVLEVIFSNGLGNAVAGWTGFASLVVGHCLVSDGEDTMEMMQAVLDTNFWLATHVTAITIGYAATFVAGFIGIAYILGGVITSALDKNNSRILGRMIYGIICFATLFSFTGTVLGGIWADQSWGRFWGWDPKENGALIIVLWNALILHARWGGMVRERGLAVLSVFGNIVTAWSWFGTNMLGVGLHSYGFMSGAVIGLVGFVVVQLAIMAVGMMPMNYWNSYAALRRQPLKKTRVKKAVLSSANNS